MDWTFKFASALIAVMLAVATTRDSSRRATERGLIASAMLMSTTAALAVGVLRFAYFGQWEWTAGLGLVLLVVVYARPPGKGPPPSQAARTSPSNKAPVPVQRSVSPGPSRNSGP